MQDNKLYHKTTQTSKLKVVGLVQYDNDAAAGTACLTAGAFWIDGGGIVKAKI